MQAKLGVDMGEDRKIIDKNEWYKENKTLDNSIENLKEFKKNKVIRALEKAMMNDGTHIIEKLSQTPRTAMFFATSQIQNTLAAILYELLMGEPYKEDSSTAEEKIIVGKRWIPDPSQISGERMEYIYKDETKNKIKKDPVMMMREAYNQVGKKTEVNPNKIITDCCFVLSAIHDIFIDSYSYYKKTTYGVENRTLPGEFLTITLKLRELLSEVIDSRDEFNKQIEKAPISIAIDLIEMNIQNISPKMPETSFFGSSLKNFTKDLTKALSQIPNQYDNKKMEIIPLEIESRTKVEKAKEENEIAEKTQPINNTSPRQENKNAAKTEQVDKTLTYKSKPEEHEDAQDSKKSENTGPKR